MLGTFEINPLFTGGGVGGVRTIPPSLAVAGPAVVFPSYFLDFNGRKIWRPMPQIRNKHGEEFALAYVFPSHSSSGGIFMREALVLSCMRYVSK